MIVQELHRVIFCAKVFIETWRLIAADIQRENARVAAGSGTGINEDLVKGVCRAIEKCNLPRSCRGQSSTPSCKDEFVGQMRAEDMSFIDGNEVGLVGHVPYEFREDAAAVVGGSAVLGPSAGPNLSRNGMLAMKTRPFGFHLSIVSTEFDSHVTKSLSDLKGYFANEAAHQALLNSDDHVVYEVHEMKRPEVSGELLHGLSIVHPGLVGDEYLMTKGHYHCVRHTAQIYYCLGGSGILLMENTNGEWAAEDLHPGRVVYVAPEWAHRSINTSETRDLVTFFLYPGHAGHDYGSIVNKRFRKRVLRQNGRPVLLDTEG